MCSLHFSEKFLLFWLFTALNSGLWAQNVNIQHKVSQAGNCPDNIDFEFGQFSNWTCKFGDVQCDTALGVNKSNLRTVTSLPNSHLLIRSSTGVFDKYGPIPLSAPDGSNWFIRLGSDINDYGKPMPNKRSESVEYSFTVPSIGNYNLTYDYAAVLEEPIDTGKPHLFCQKPRFQIIISDAATGDILPCGFVDYTADSSSAAQGGFIKSTFVINQSQNPGVAWYKPWTTVFVNLSKYAGRNIKIKFVTSDCTLGGHWGYAYLDVRNCDMGMSAFNTCNTPIQTILKGPAGFIGYNWWDAAYSVSYGNTKDITLSPSLAGGTTIHLELLPVNGASCRDTVTLLVKNQESTLNKASDKRLCKGNSVTLGTSNPPGYIYSWSPANYLSSVSTPITSASPPITTTYYLTATDPVSGCINKDTVELLVDPMPVININNGSICEGDSLLLTVSGVDSAIWTFAPELEIKSALTAMVKPVFTAQYFVTGVKTNSLCSKDSFTTVVVNAAPTGDININGDSIICQNSPKQLTLVSSTATSYQWFRVDSQGISHPIPGANALSYATGDPGIYFVELWNALGCKSLLNDSIELLSFPPPKADFTFPLVCQGAPLQFNNNSSSLSASPLLYQWNFGDGSPFSSEKSPVHIYTESGNFHVFLTVSSMDCPGSFTTRDLIIPIEKPRPGIRYPDAYAGKNRDLQLGARSFGMHYLWTPFLAINRNDIISPVFNYDKNVVYQIEITSDAGCKTVDTQRVLIYNGVDIKVPTAFSPNGDGHNDYLDIFLIDIAELKWFRVFNRWGQLLFETTDPRQRWDGKYKGLMQPAETYIWLAEGVGGDGSRVIRRGQCILLR